MVREFFQGAIRLTPRFANAPKSALDIANTPMEEVAIANPKPENWQDNLRYLHRQESCGYCLLKYRDNLTKLANKRYFNIWLEQVWKRVTKEQVALSIILIEIDYLKIYHKSWGDDAAEHCLQQVAKVISEWVQPPDGLAARFDSEKFALIIPQAKATNVLKIAERIRKNVKKLAFYHDSQMDGLPDRVVTVSLGIGIGIGQLEVAPSILMHAAEDALYQSQRKGRDRTEVKYIVASSG
jgi:diguanylate cyclase (GGDEF)-like protein